MSQSFHPFRDRRRAASIAPARALTRLSHLGAALRLHTLWRHSAIACPVLLCLLPLVAMRIYTLASPWPQYDFITYWASGHLFLAGGDPYSTTAIFALEKSQGFSLPAPLIMLNPPWTLPVVSAAAILPFLAGRFWWMVLSILLDGVSAVALWSYFGGPRRYRWMALVAAATFLPMGTAEHVGQLTPLILASLVAFLYLMRAERYFLAGACLLLVGLKPHLLYLVALAVVLWLVQHRKWGLALGAVSSYTASTAVAILVNPRVTGFFHGTMTVAMNNVCGIGGVLREVFGMQHTWLQFLPTVVSIAWFLWYWTRHRSDWDWSRQIPLLVLVSVCASPNTWFHDFILVLPAVMAIAVEMPRLPRHFAAILGFYFGIQIVILAAGQISRAWISAAGLLWLRLYLLARHWTSTADQGRDGVVERIDCLTTPA
jgi:hypothetical protein